MALALIVNSKCEVSETGLSLKELQTAVDGLIQPIDISENLTMWVNEEFLYREQDPNPVATSFFQTFARGEYPIQGSVVFTGGSDEEGKTLGLKPEDEQLIRQFSEHAILILTSVVEH